MSKQKMRILWICNLIMPEYSDIYGVKKSVLEGWMSGMYNMLNQREDIVIACCFPIRDEAYMKQSRQPQRMCYSFHAVMDKNDPIESDYEEFVSIYKDFNPDVIHIWGSEYPHSSIAVQAAIDSKLQNKVIVHIQGLVSAIVPYFSYGVPNDWLDYQCNGKPSIRASEIDFDRRGVYEIKALLNSRIVLGRTSWDKAYVESVSPNIHYRSCEEILRDEFYQSEIIWDVHSCERHSLMISQASYSIKGLHLILSAIEKLHYIYEDLKVYVCGGGAIASKDTEKESPYDRLIINMIAELGISDVFEFTGAKGPKEMIEQYLKANVFICSSTIENSSNSIGEAQLLGVPVVATYTGGTPDLVKHKQTGLLYQMDAEYMFLSCVKQIFDDDELALQLSENERKVALKRYDREVVTKQLMSIYEEVAHN